MQEDNRLLTAKDRAWLKKHRRNILGYTALGIVAAITAIGTIAPLLDKTPPYHPSVQLGTPAVQTPSPTTTPLAGEQRAPALAPAAGATAKPTPKVVPTPTPTPAFVNDPSCFPRLTIDPYLTSLVSDMQATGYSQDEIDQVIAKTHWIIVWQDGHCRY